MTVAIVIITQGRLEATGQPANGVLTDSVAHEGIAALIELESAPGMSSGKRFASSMRDALGWVMSLSVVLAIALAAIVLVVILADSCGRSGGGP